MSILIRHLFKIPRFPPSSKLTSQNHINTSILSYSSSIMASMSHHPNTTSSTLNAAGASKRSVHSHEYDGSSSSSSTPEEKYDYESAVVKLHSLVSNAEVLAALRTSTTREYRHMTHIPNINKFILRSGITEEEVDKMSIIHVSGTKGKGSTCAFCESILRSKGYKTGLFTSPHLLEVRERIRINGRPVSKEVYAYHFWKVYNRLMATQEDKDERLPAYFAFNMILSLHIFLSEAVDVSIIEVGIGGQYDSTNFIRKPVVCGVTSLGFDHVSILGNTIEQIAWNKAGIFKTGNPAISVNQPPSAMQVLLDRAKERQSALYLSTAIEKDVLDRECVSLGISGRKQADNAGLAVQLARVWEERRKALCTPMPCNVLDVSTTEGIPVLETTQMDSGTAKGLSSCVWPGRAQVITRPGMAVTYYLDGAHTTESIEVCSQWFKEQADQEMKSLKGKVARVLIFNVTGERKPGPLLECLMGCGFDAAGFCTNSVSTVESYNKKDQINPKYTSTAMMQKAEENKECWDELLHAQSDNINLKTPVTNSPEHSSRSSKQEEIRPCANRGSETTTTTTTVTTTTMDGMNVKKRIIDNSISSVSSHNGSSSTNTALRVATPSSVSSSSSISSSSVVSSASSSSFSSNERNDSQRSNTQCYERSPKSCVLASDSDNVLLKDSKDRIGSKRNKNRVEDYDNVNSNAILTTGINVDFAEKNNNCYYKLIDDQQNQLDIQTAVHRCDLEGVSSFKSGQTNRQQQHQQQPQLQRNTDTIDNSKSSSPPASNSTGLTALNGCAGLINDNTTISVVPNSAKSDDKPLVLVSSSPRNAITTTTTTIPTSQSFPCVLQALVWAGQGKDGWLGVQDVTVTLPPPPQVLADTDHVQVLVTGSLLLVGAVLGVVHPRIND